jgi:hypothetical protein
MAIWIFCHYLKYFMTLWYILCSFGTFFRFLVSCTEKNLATLVPTCLADSGQLLTISKYRLSPSRAKVVQNISNILTAAQQKSTPPGANPTTFEFTTTKLPL